ncbi:MAG TPA: fibronectin type III domain-containing protein [bacterium]|nr:fibronectin type III domain-containing protein [bacterium]
MKNLIIFILIIISFKTLLNGAKFWDVYFTPQNNEYNSDFEKNIESIVKTAKKSIDISSYSWGESSHNLIVQAINLKYNQGISVRVLGDNDEPFSPYLAAGIPKKNDASDPTGTYNLMHNKLIIIDAGTANAKIITGSTNWTDGAYSQQNNNSLVFYHTGITNLYKKKFDSLWAGNFYNIKTPTTNNKFEINGKTVEIYFSPEDNPGFTKLLPLLQQAKKSILFLTNKQKVAEYAQACVEAKNRGAIVEGVYEGGSIYEYDPSVVKIYLNNGIDVRKDANFSTMHHKYYVIDLEYVVIGSMNQSAMSSMEYAENLVIVKDPALAREYAREFKKVFEMTSKPDPYFVGTPYHSTTKPNSITNVNAIGADEKSFYISWNKLRGSPRFNRYLIYIQDYKFNSVENLRPEKTDITDKNITSATLSTYNEGDELVAGKSYYIAITAIDDFGNESDLGPTSIFGPVSLTGEISAGEIEFLTASDGTNTINTFTNDERLKDEDITISFEIANSNSGDEVKVYWAKNNLPTGGNAKIITANYSNKKWQVQLSKTEYSNDDVIYFNIYYKGQKKGIDYKFKIDSFSPVPENIKVSGIGKNSVKLNWTIPSRYTDVVKYRVYYGNDTNITKANKYQEFTENYGSVINLSQSTSYYFRVSSIDDLGQESELSEIVSATTLFGSGAEVKQITDGKNYITDFSGEGILGYASITIYFEVKTQSPESANVRVYYDVDGFPDGPNGINADQRSVPVLLSGTSGRAVIPTSDKEFKDGAVYQFGICVNDVMYYNDEIPWRFMIRGQLIPKITNLSIDNIQGTSLRLNWQQLNNAYTDNFKTYKIYYSEGDEVNFASNVITNANNPFLGNITTNNIVIDKLLPNKKYSFFITVEDKYNIENEKSDTISAITTQTGTLVISEINYSYTDKKIDWIELYVKEGPIDLSKVYLTILSEYEPMQLAQKVLILSKGEYAVVHFSDGITESDDYQDLNSNGYRDIYVGVKEIKKADGIVLTLSSEITNVNEKLDGIIFKTELNENIANYYSSDTDLSLVLTGIWLDTGSEGHINFWGGTSLNRIYFGNSYLDTNKKSDWQVSFLSSAGKRNNQSILQNLIVSDGTNTIEFPNMSSYLQDTNIRVEVKINGKFEYDTMLYLSVGKNIEPDGLGSVNDTFISLNKISANNEYYEGYAIIPESFVNDNDKIYFKVLVVSGKDKIDNLTANEQYLFQTYVFNIDGKAINKVTNLDILSIGQNYVVLKWTLPFIQEDDFKYFKIFYSKDDNLTINSEYLLDEKLMNSKTTLYSINNLEAGETYYFCIGIFDKVLNYSLSDTKVCRTKDKVNIEKIYLNNAIETQALETNGQTIGYNNEIIITILTSGITSNDTLYLYYLKGAKDYSVASTIGDSLPMNKISSNQYQVTITTTNITEEQIRFLIKYRDYFIRDDYNYFYVIKSQCDTVRNLKEVNTGSNYTIINWQPIRMNDADFKEFRIYYSKNSVDINSSYLDYQTIPQLKNKNLQLVKISNLESEETYNIRVAVFDNYGNWTISDTLTIKTYPSLELNNINASDGENNISEFFEVKKLKGDTITITIVTNEIPDTNIILSYYKNNESETNLVMPNQKSNYIYEYKIPPQKNNDIIYFEFLYKNYVYKNITMEPYKIQIDTEPLPAVSNFRFDTGQSTNLFIVLSWQPISEIYKEEFKEYRIYYAKGNEELTKNSNYFTNLIGMTNYKKSIVLLTNLEDSTKYTFAIASVDKVGNISDFSNTFCINTITMIPFEDPATDGINKAIKLDGTEYLQAGEIFITFEFTRQLYENEEAYLCYGIDTLPEGANQIRKKMSKENNIVYALINLNNDTRIKDETKISYFVELNGIKLLNNNNYFSFKIDKRVPDKIENFRCINDGGANVILGWTANTNNDFVGYEIKYGTNLDEEKIINYKTEPKLKNQKLTLYTLSGLAQNKNYYIQITAIDKVGYKNYSEKIYLKRVKEDNIKIIAITDTTIKVLKNETKEIKVRVLNNDLPLSDYKIQFKINDNKIRNYVNVETQYTDNEGYVRYKLDLSKIPTKVGLTNLEAVIEDENKKEQKIRFVIFFTENENLIEKTQIYYSSE